VLSLRALATADDCLKFRDLSPKLIDDCLKDRGRSVAIGTVGKCLEAIGSPLQLLNIAYAFGRLGQLAGLSEIG